MKEYKTTSIEFPVELVEKIGDYAEVNDITTRSGKVKFGKAVVDIVEKYLDGGCENERD